MQHPRFSAWVVLASGMVALLVVEARNVGLLPSQWVALIVATVLVAGACIWIISWEDKDNPEDEAEISAAEDADCKAPKAPPFEGAQINSITKICRGDGGSPEAPLLEFSHLRGIGPMTPTKRSTLRARASATKTASSTPSTNTFAKSARSTGIRKSCGPL